MDLATILSSELTLPVPMRDGSVREVKFTEDQMEAAVDLFLGKDPDTGLVPNGSIAPTPTELITLLILMESDAL